MLRRTFLSALLIGASSAKADVIYHDTSEVAAATTKRVLNFYGPTWCPACPVALEAVKKELSNEFEIVVHKDYDKYPAWVLAQGQQPGWGYPMVHWVNKADAGKIMVWSGIDEFRKHDGVKSKIQQAGGPAKLPFVQPDQQDTRAVARQSLIYNPSHSCSNCGRTEFEIENDDGPYHTHRCSRCNTVWYHKDR